MDDPVKNGSLRVCKKKFEVETCCEKKKSEMLWLKILRRRRLRVLKNFRGQYFIFYTYFGNDVCGHTCAIQMKLHTIDKNIYHFMIMIYSMKSLRKINSFTDKAKVNLCMSRYLKHQTLLFATTFVQIHQE